jgi:integration host factor subunit alpha
MTLTKQDLIDLIYRQVTIPKYQSTRLVESLLEIIKHTLEFGEDVLISGFGKFYVRNKKKRKGRNPQAAEDMILRARKVVVFRCSGVLRERINGKG